MSETPNPSMERPHTPPRNQGAPWNSPTEAKVRASDCDDNDQCFEYPELVFAFVAPLGVDLSITENAVAKRLEEIGYSTERIGISHDVLPQLDRVPQREFANEYERIGTMMDIGTRARVKYGPDILAEGVASEIQKRRRGNKGRPRTAYLVHSLKHPEEVRRLRTIYPRGFYLFAVNVPPDARKKHLIGKSGMTQDRAEELMRRDKLEDEPNGQQVNQTFHMADFFVGWARDIERVQSSVHRFVDIAFGAPHRTPSFGEYAMYLAFAASLRSADLSRQVGAVIARDGEILSTGANDCPKAGGGLYWPFYDIEKKAFEDFPNGRDYMRGEDSNRKAQLQIIDDIITRFRGKRTPPNGLRKLKAILEDSAIGCLTEFGRVVHAEMEAILACGRKSISARGATLYCMTFPCHNCAKHIIAAGIKRVVFVEPYLKSKATNLHDEVIKIEYPEASDSEDHVSAVVRFEPFFGVGPHR
ncbi:MAG TPA: anti-phage dCTP deaminase, partial [Fimbriimonas sp.]|nr:anti-phage dCTP deaminase [Fimbriimonas sp.]